MTDSFRDEFARVSQRVEKMKRAPNETKDKYSVIEWRVTKGSGQDIETLIALKPSAVQVSVQGYGCLATGNNRDRLFLRVTPRPGLGRNTRFGKPGFDGGEGVVGFAPRSALRGVASLPVSRVREDCGNNHGRAAVVNGTLEKQAYTPVAPGETFNPDGDTGDTQRFQGSTSVGRQCADPPPGTPGGRYLDPKCGIPYQSSFQPQLFNGEITNIAVGTTGISGQAISNKVNGGTLFAIVRTGGSFKRVDSIGYNDPNVPCRRRPEVRWFFGNVNPGGSRPIFGWVPRLMASQQARRDCQPQP